MIHDILTESLPLGRSASASSRRVFISHQRENSAYALALAKYVEGLGYEPWLAIIRSDVQAAHTAGDHEALTRKILTGILMSPLIIIAVSKTTVKSAWIPFEAGAALAASHRLAYVLGNGVAPESLPEWYVLGDRLSTERELKRWLSREVNQIGRRVLAESAAARPVLEELRKHMRVEDPRLVIPRRQ